MSGDDPLTAEDMTTLAKEIDKLTREYLKRGDGRAFAPVDGDKPGKPVGVGCFTVGESRYPTSCLRSAPKACSRSGLKRISECEGTAGDGSFFLAALTAFWLDAQTDVQLSVG